MSMTTDRANRIDRPGSDIAKQGGKTAIEVPILKAQHFQMVQGTVNSITVCDFQWWASRIFPPSDGATTIDKRVIDAFDRALMRCPGIVRGDTDSSTMKVMHNLTPAESETMWIETLYELDNEAFDQRRDGLGWPVPIALFSVWRGWDAIVENHNVYRPEPEPTE